MSIYFFPKVTIFLLLLYAVLTYLYPHPWFLTDTKRHNPFLLPSCQSYMRRHFPIHMHPTLNKYPQQCIYIYIPHGLIVFYGQMLQALQYLPHASNTYMLVHSLLHRCMYTLPGISSVYQHTQLDNCSKETCRKYLQEGKSIVLVPGATRDVMVASLSNESIPIAIHHTQGYLQLAYEYNVPIVPIVCPAEYHVMKKWGIMPWERWLAKRWNMMWPCLKTWIPTPHPDKPVSMYMGPCFYPGQYEEKEEMKQDILNYVTSCFKQEGRQCHFI